MKIAQPEQKSRVELLEKRTLLSAGALDTSFNTTGVETLGQPSGFVVNDVAVQTDGKTIVAGTQTVGNTYAVLERLNVDGSLDTTFGNNGTGYVYVIQSPSTTATFPVTISAIVVQAADNNIFVVGNTRSGNDTRGYLARFNADGTTDTAFGKSTGEVGVGYQSANFDNANYSTAADIALQQNGEIVVCGGAYGEMGDRNFGVARFYADGDFDGTLFGTIGLGGDEVATRIAIDYSGTAATNSNYGKVLLGGIQGTDTAAFVRLDTKSNLDSSFSDDGEMTTTFGNGITSGQLKGMVIQSTDNIIIEGDVHPADGSAQKVALLRLTPNGHLDNTFASFQLQAFAPFPTGTIAGGLINGQSGQLLVGGYGTGTTVRVACFTPDGLIDTNFGNSGVLTIPNCYSGADNFVLEPGGTVVVGGSPYIGHSIARFFDRKPETVAIGTFNPNLYEQGMQGTTFVVTRLERLPTAQRVYLSVTGTANRPGNFSNHAVDYTGTNITFGSARLGAPTYVDIPADQTYTIVTITPVDDALVEGDETANFYIQASSDFDITPTGFTTLVIHDNDITAGPSVRSSAFNYLTAPQSVSYTFDQDVSSSIDPSDFSVVGPSGAVPFTLAYDNVNDLATLSFGSILANGNYTATAFAAGITNSAGTRMTADSPLAFFFLNGDINHDRKVDVVDLGILSSHWQMSGVGFANGDLNYDGVVDVVDLGILSSNWQQSVAAPPTPAISKSTRRSLTPVARIFNELRL